MKFQCQFCNCAIHNVTQWMLGKKIICPNCSKNVLLPSHPFGTGRIIGDFIIEEKIGEGSIGIVYLAHQASLDRKVALKILSKEYTTAKGKNAFLSEARAAAKLSHPNLVQCLAVGEEEGVCYMAMNYIRGPTLTQRIKAEGRIEVDEALHITQQVAEALHYAWTEASLIHRDVKPENIMIDDDGVVKLTDLGLAMPEHEWHEGMEISGSPSYMSPEQFTGEKLDTRSDIYSLGVTLYQMLTGKLPFEGKTLNTVARQHFTEIPVPVDKIVPTIPKNVSNLVSRMLAKRPEDRFRDMDHLLHEIWSIRQTTAPEKELIPSVHTVTLKKLDYDLQHQAKARKVQILISEEQERKKSELLLKILAFTVPTIILISIFLFAKFYQKEYKNKKALKIIKKMENALIDEDISISSLQQEFEKNKSLIQKLDKNLDPLIFAKLSLIEEKIENLKLKERIKVLETQISSLALRLHDMEVKAKEFSQSFITNSPPSKQEKEKEKELKIKQLEAKILNLERELKTEKEKNQNLHHMVKSFQERDFKAWCDDVRIKISLLLKNNRLNEAKNLVSFHISNTASEREKEWLAIKKAELENLERIFSIFENSGQRFADIELKEGKIKEITGSNVILLNKLGVPETLPWKNLSLESLKKILPPNALSVTQAEKLPYYLALLNGRFSEAVEVISKDTEAKETMLAIRNYIFENIKFLAATDKKRAALRADEFLRDFSGTDDIDKIKSELVQLIKE